MTSQPSEVDFPYRAIRNFTPTPDHPGSILLKIGDEGQVLADVTRGWVKISLGATGRQGWVPRSAITVGTTRKVGNPAFEHDIPVIGSTGFNINFVRGSHPLERALRALALGFKTNLTAMPFVGTELRAMLLNDVKRESYVDLLVQNLDPAFIQIANDPNSTTGQFMRVLQPVQPGNHNLGFYSRITKDFQGNPGRKPEFYIGKTVGGFAERLAGHRSATNDLKDQSAATRSTRDASSLAMYPICVTTGSSEFVALGEKLLICCTGSYVPAMKAPLANAVQDVVGKDNLTKNVGHIEAANIISGIARVVFADLNWIPLCERPTFGVNGGLNTASPLKDHDRQSKILWVKTEQVGVMSVYHRGPAKVYLRTNGSSRAVCMGPDFLIDVLIAGKDDAGGPPIGSTVYPVVEIMTNGPHHTPYARLPEVGPFSDWHYGNRVGIRFEWQDANGQWYQRYSQRQHVRRFMDKTVPGSLCGYATALSVLRYLEQITQSEPRTWDVDLGIARVKELKFDHLTQTATLFELAPKGISMVKSTRKPRAQIVAEL